LYLVNKESISTKAIFILEEPVALATGADVVDALLLPAHWANIKPNANAMNPLRMSFIVFIMILVCYFY
jgi:hypothetical protein